MGILTLVQQRIRYRRILIPIHRESKIGRECDFPTSFIPFEGSEMILEEEIDEFLKHDESLNMNLNDEFNDEDGDIIFLEKLLEDENFFQMNDKKVESFERKTKEDFETKVEPKSKQELQVFHPDIEILNHFENTSYVGSDYVFYEDFSLVDIIFPVNIQGKVFDPGISHFEKDAFKDKSSKELAPSKALLTLDVFDPLHPPLMNFHVTKAFSGFTFSLLKLFSKKFLNPDKKSTVFRILEDSWFNIVEGQSNSHNFHDGSPILLFISWEFSFSKDKKDKKKKNQSKTDKKREKTSQE
ncbi:hypothetical protein Tco_0946256 [Tanacetum coccineum]